MSGLLLETPLTSEQRDFVSTVRMSSDALLDLINDILDFSKIESGKLELEEQAFDVRGCIEDSLELLSVRAAEKGLDLAYVVDEGVPDTNRRRHHARAPSARQPAQQRRQIHRYRRNFGHGQSRGDRRWPVHGALLVRDSGIGIPAERFDRLFQSFQPSRRLDHTPLRRHRSWPRDQQAPQRADGRAISCDSVVGQGSTFHFSIVAASAPNRPQLYLRGDQPHLRDKRVLVVDDNPTNLAILARRLEGWGMKVTAATSAADGLAALEKECGLRPGAARHANARLRRAGAGHQDSRPGDAADELPLLLATRSARRSAQRSSGVGHPRMSDSRSNRPCCRRRGGAPRPGPLRLAVASAAGSGAESAPPARRGQRRQPRVAIHILRKARLRPPTLSQRKEAIEARSSAALRHRAHGHAECRDGRARSERHIHRRFGDKRPRIFAMRANAQQSESRALLAAGMDGYISSRSTPKRLGALLTRQAPVVAERRAR